MTTIKKIQTDNNSFFILRKIPNAVWWSELGKFFDIIAVASWSPVIDGGMEKYWRK